METQDGGGGTNTREANASALLCSALLKVLAPPSFPGDPSPSRESTVQDCSRAAPADGVGARCRLSAQGRTIGRNHQRGGKPIIDLGPYVTGYRSISVFDRFERTCVFAINCRRLSVD